jgi:hypothetical protein
VRACEADRGAVVGDCEGVPFGGVGGVGGGHVEGGEGEDDVQDWLGWLVREGLRERLVGV